MTLKAEKDKFHNVAKRILKKDLSTNVETLATYKVDIVKAYNDFIDYATLQIIQLTKSNEDLKETFITATFATRQKFIKCLKNLNLTYQFGTKPFERVEISKLIEQLNESDISSEEEFDIPPENPPEMAAPTQIEFISAYTKLIPPFDGDLDKKQAFLDALELIRLNVGAHNDVAVSMIKSKLTKKARTCLQASDNTVQLIINRITTEIKGESSDSIVAKIHNIKQKDKSANKYVKEIEDLAELLKTAFISEGVPPQLAEKYSTQQSVIAMKHNASNEKVKLVMEAGKFDNLNEAVAKFVGTNNETPSQSSVMFMSQQRSYGRFNRRNNYQNQNSYRNFNQYRGNGFRGNNNRGNGNRYQNNSQNYNNSYRGNYRGNRRGNYGSNNYNINNSSDRERVRYVEDQGNVANPQLLTLGEHAGSRAQRN